MTQPCPRQTNEATMASQIAHESHWREDGKCSYCGSLSPAQFFEAIERGDELGPTDKDYKVYVKRPNPNAGRPHIAAVANFDPGEEGWILVTKENIDALPKEGWSDLLGQWIRIGPDGPSTHDKFYFQHLDEEGKLRFVDLLNAKKINVGPPGHFYRLPFFVRREHGK